MFRNITKWLYSLFGKPYMSTVVKFNRKNGSTTINAVYNQAFIMELDQLYLEAGNNDYNPMLADNVKLAFYLADGFDSILGRYEQSMMRDKLRTEDEEEESFAGVPNLGDRPVRQVFDISKMERAGGQMDG